MSRKIGLITVLIVAAVLLYSFIGQIYNSLEAAKRLDQEQDQLDKLKKENQELKKRAQQVSSWQFIEQQARNKLGYSREGETVVIIPESELAKVLEEKKPQEVKLPNWEGWVRLFFN